MPCSCSVIINAMEELAPARLTQNWDNTGLLLGDPGQHVSKVLVALDITPEVVEEAIIRRAELIITHHPVIFQPVRNLRKDKPIGQMLFKLIQNNISVYSAHTNLDMARGGVNDTLASLLKLENVQILQPLESEKLKKVVVFVPIEYVGTVREAMAKAGAGFIGNYSDCSFITKGVGTFKPLEGSNPFIGETGELEQVEECRIETVVPESISGKVIKSMLDAHPYEEVAYDIYSVENSYNTYGFARIGKLGQSTELGKFAEAVKNILGSMHVRMVGDANKKVENVVVSSGSYSSIVHIAREKGADVIVTGDLKYHDARDILDYGLSAVDAGHFSTENIIVPVIIKHISSKLNNLGIKVIKSEKSQDIFTAI